jgi:hypothetical protein
MRDLRAITTWLLREAKAAAGIAREREIWIALAAGLLLWALAYQAADTYRLDLGGNLQTGRRYDDEPFLGDTFNKSEPADPIPAGTQLLLRWSKAESTIVFPGLGGGSWLARINASSGPRPTPVLSRWSDGRTTTDLTVGAAQRDYRLVVSADSAGDLTLRFATPPFDPPGDPRSLGLVMARVTVEPIAGARLPAWRQLALLACALALAYLLLRRFALSAAPTLACVLALAALAALLLARERMALTLLTPRLPAILAGCYALGLALDAIYQRLDQGPRTKDDIAHDHIYRRSSMLDRQPGIVALILLAAALRLGGVLHPHARFSDDGLNANNLIGFTSGQVYFTEGLPSESGGGQAPYPPGQYLMFAPAQLIVLTLPNELTSIRLILKIANALWDSLVVGLVWYLLHRRGLAPRAALLGAALYALPPPLLKSLSVGEFANIFGQGLALPLLALLANRAGELRRPAIFAALVGLLGLALLGHLGVTISLACLLGCLGVVWLARVSTRRASLSLGMAAALAAALVGLFYYTALGDVLFERVYTPGPMSVSLADKLTRELNRSRDLGLHPLALTLGALGMGLLIARPRRWPYAPPQPALGALLLAWWGGTLLSLGLLLFASQGVRWQSFLYPALCVGAGPALAGLWQRGRAGRIVSAGLASFLLWYGLAYWVAQISDYLH